MSSRTEKTRRRILDAARTLLEAEGPGGALLRDVAEAASVSRQAIYLHFENRQGLLVALVEYIDEVEGLPQAIAPIAAAATGREALELTIQVLADYAPRIHRIATVIEAASVGDEDMAAAFADRMAHRRRGFQAVFARLAAEGALRPEWTVDRATDAFLALSTPHTYSDLVVVRGWTADEYANLLRRICFTVLVDVE